MTSATLRCQQQGEEQQQELKKLALSIFGTTRPCFAGNKRSSSTSSTITSTTTAISIIMANTTSNSNNTILAPSATNNRAAISSPIILTATIFVALTSRSNDISSAIPSFSGAAQAKSANSQSQSDPSSLGSLACSRFSSPKVALCVHGGVRSFTHVLVRHTMKEYFVDSLLPNATVFAHITRLDSRGDAHQQYAGLFKEVTEEEIRDAAAFVGAIPSNIEVVEGPNVEVPSCQTDQEGADNVTSPASTRNGCLQLISRHENKTGEMFDAILLVRADLTVYVPFAPGCLYDFEHVHSLVDWYHSLPRSKARLMITEPYEKFFGCTKLTRLRKDVDDYLAPFFGAAHMSTANLPVMITRENLPRFPNNMCNMFRNPFALKQDPNPEHLCKFMTYANTYNRQPGKGEVTPVSAAQTLCRQAAKPPRIALCVHGSLASELPEAVSQLRERHFSRQLGSEVTTFLHLVVDVEEGGDEDGRLRQELRARLGAKEANAVFPASVGKACGESPDAASELQWHQDQCLTMIESSGNFFDIVAMFQSGVVPIMGLKPYCMYNSQLPRRYLNLAYMAPPKRFRQAIATWKSNCSSNPANSTLDLMGETFPNDESMAMGRYSPSDPCKFFETMPWSLLNPGHVKRMVRGIPLSPNHPGAICQRKHSTLPSSSE
eukprot:CAMPEP_0206533530 /NCGR_PEP_ID=MMETSP0325_2-20121206/5012_1 /ASSEMBLY_ACC=CAM_ASM_000347 /TAXON_ID=2866 /ORGANISM="Crypthecodinium cohnii, Strain Seligo" /LENGTH=661 /DNA_ID=CAMNT_0054030175 /DNA_START=26 /DNA_END=2011 /DNA_ORIENTATION=-